MAEDGSVVIKINGDDSGLRQTMNNVNQTVNQAAQTAANSAQQIDTAAQAAAQAVHDVGTQAENAAEGMTDASNASQRATNAMSNVNAQAEAAASGLSNVGNASQNAQSATIDYSAALARMEAYLGQSVTALTNIENELENISKREKDAGENGESAFKKVASGALKAVGAIGKIAGALTTAAVTGVGALAKNATECYAEYEQLVGGVETLFGDSAGTVKQYADNAFKTAQISANNYMDTVTSFSASLLQGLDGDTAKAAEVANTAIIDMADNANKMGTDMASIQNAYQGFAKQNYTMLDNLKLGYGGTQAEMARLINESGVLGDTMTVTAENVNDVSFDKMIEAIHVVQDNLGITGTSAKEASTTIQGSIASLSSAWQNLMTGIADPTQDFDTLLGNVVESLTTVVDRLMPTVSAILPQMATGLSELTEELLLMIPDTIEELLPAVLEGANALIETLLTTLSEIAETAAPIIAENADTIIDTLVTSLETSAPNLATAAVGILAQLTESILNNVGSLVGVALDIITALVDGIAQALPQLIPAAVSMITEIVETAYDKVGDIVSVAVELIEQLIVGLVQALPKLIAEAPTIIDKLIKALIDVVPELVQGVPDAIVNGIGEGLISFDWSGFAEQAMSNLGNALEDAQKGLALVWGEWLTNGSVYGGDINNVSTTGMVDAYRSGTEVVVESLKAADEAAEESIEVNEKWQKSVMNGYAETAKAAEEERQKRAEARKKEQEETNKAAEEADGKVSDEFKSFYEGIKLEKAMGDIDNDEYIRQLSEKLNSDASYKSAAYTKYWNEVTNANTKAEKKATEKVSDDFKSFYDDLKLLKSKGEIDEAEYIKRLKEKLNSSDEYDTSVYTSYWKEVTDAETKAAKEAQTAADKAAKEKQQAEEKAAKEAQTAKEKADKEALSDQKKAAKQELEQLKSDLSELQKTYKSKFSEIVKERDKFKDKLSESIFSTSESEETDARTGEKTKTKIDKVADLKKKIESRKKLGKYLSSLVKKGIPKNMLSELAGMDPEDALRFAAQLDGMSADKWQELKTSYAEYEDVNKRIADEVYGPQLDDLNKKYADDINGLLDGATGVAAEKGAEMIKAFISGASITSDEDFEALSNDISDVFTKLSDAISDSTLVNGKLSLGLDNIDGTEAGKSIADGIADGIKDNSSVISSAITDAVNAAMQFAVNYRQSAVSGNVSASVPVSVSTETVGNTAANSTQNVQLVPVNLLWKDGKVLAEIVNAENQKANIRSGK